MKNYKFRASEVSNIIFSRGKLTEANKNYLIDLYIEREYGRKKIIYSDAMYKGIVEEQTSIDLLNEVKGTKYQKNDKQLQNKYVTGTPDIIATDEIIDVKTAFDIFTFAKIHKISTQYEWQLRAYMWLTGLKKAKLVYTLVDTPLNIQEQEMSYLNYKNGYAEGSLDYHLVEDQVRANHTFEDIEASKRVKVFEIEHDDAKIDKLKGCVKAARTYLNLFTL